MFHVSRTGDPDADEPPDEVGVRRRRGRVISTPRKAAAPLRGVADRIAVTVIAIATLVTYPRMLSRALKPEPVSVALYVDPNRVVHTATPVSIIEATIA
jgi:hypothetical protein